MDQQRSHGTAGAVVAVIATYLAAPLSLDLFHGGLVVFDGYHHVKVAASYAEHWYSPLVEGVGAGISMEAYPPLSHQIMVVVSSLPGIDVFAAYMIVTAIGAGLLSYSVVRYVVSITDREPSPLAVLLVGFSPPVLVTVFVFGQLPTIIGLGVGFFGLLVLERVCTDQRSWTGVVLAILLLAVTGFLHHFSLALVMFLFFLRFPFLLDEMERGGLIRLTATGLGVLALLGIGVPAVVRTVLAGGPERAVLSHSSRYPLSSLVGVWGFLVPLLGPALLATLLPDEDRCQAHGVLLPALVIAVISLGLHTPFPAVLFGGMATWITYDRFMVLASLLVVPLLAHQVRAMRWRRGVVLGAVVVSLAVTVHAHLFMFGASVGTIAHTDEQQQQALEFLGSVDGSYRYHTFGYRGPVGDLYSRTDVPALSTDYYSGYRHNWLRMTASTALDTPDPDLAREILVRADEISLRYLLVFRPGWEVRDREEDWFDRNLPPWPPIPESIRDPPPSPDEWVQNMDGWDRSNRSTELMTVWINEDVDPVEPPDREPHWRRGTVPVLTLVALIGVMGYRYRRWS